jgi:hypothetical protein
VSAEDRLAALASSGARCSRTKARRQSSHTRRVHRRAAPRQTAGLAAASCSDLESKGEGIRAPPAPLAACQQSNGCGIPSTKCFISNKMHEPFAQRTRHRPFPSDSALRISLLPPAVVAYAITRVRSAEVALSEREVKIHAAPTELVPTTSPTRNAVAKRLTVSLYAGFRRAVTRGEAHRSGGRGRPWPDRAMSANSTDADERSSGWACLRGRPRR